LSTEAHIWAGRVNCSHLPGRHVPQTVGMKLPQTLLDVAGSLRRSDANRQDARQYHLSVLDFTDGVEVTEIVGTLPGELQELLAPDLKSST
jgi:hypothetical protein